VPEFFIFRQPEIQRPSGSSPVCLAILFNILLPSSSLHQEMERMRAGIYSLERLLEPDGPS
jgi:hypothetical protein